MSGTILTFPLERAVAARLACTPGELRIEELYQPGEPLRMAAATLDSVPASQPRIPLTMPALRWPTVCGPLGSCAHERCLVAHAHAGVPCRHCHQAIGTGERYVVVEVINKRPTVQEHADACPERTC